jgi:hypothetical protein
VDMHVWDLVGINGISWVLSVHSCRQPMYPQDHILPLWPPHTSHIYTKHSYAHIYICIGTNLTHTSHICVCVCVCVCTYTHTHTKTCMFMCNVPCISLSIFSLQIVNLGTYILQFHIEYGCCQRGRGTRNEDWNFICNHLKAHFCAGMCIWHQSCHLWKESWKRDFL